MAFLKKYGKQILIGLGILNLIASVLMLFVAAPGAEVGYKKTLYIIIGLLMLLLAVLVVFYLVMTQDREPNFFLFDRSKKKNIPLTKLSFTVVNERLNFLESLVCSSPEELWTKNLLENAELGYKNVYRPLLAYKMLYDLADKDVDSYWNLLFKVSSEILNSLCRALEEAGEGDFAKALHRLVTDKSEETVLKSFITNNMKYLRSKMMHYVRGHIEMFY